MPNKPNKPNKPNDTHILPFIVKPLLAWFAANRRELPWREDRQPYHVWVSEIMLQQTRIEAVKKYYTRFMTALPDVASLSEVPEDALLKLWEGLGYYSRARNLKKAAQVIMQDYGGEFPRTYREWLELPGVGAYTAGAVASICFDEKVTAVDGNVLRVISRVIGSRKDVLLPETKREITALLQAVLPEASGDFNEALMELGELVCLPGGEPLCKECPLHEICVAHHQNLTAEIPVRIKKTKRRREDKTVFVMLTPAGKIAIEKRPEKGLLSGLYQLPNVTDFTVPEKVNGVLREWALCPTTIVPLGEAKHAFTHIDWFMKGYLITVPQENSRFLWVTPQELAETYPLPTAFQYFMKDIPGK